LKISKLERDCLIHIATSLALSRRTVHIYVDDFAGDHLVTILFLFPRPMRTRLEADPHGHFAESQAVADDLQTSIRIP